MSNADKTSHWKSLAALLGTEPAADSEPTQQENPTSPPRPPVATIKPSPPPPLAPPRVTPPKPAAPRRESNWGKLANVLGLAGAPAPEPIAKKPEPVVEPVAEKPVPIEPVWVAPAVSHTSEVAEMAAAHWDTPDREADLVIDPLEMTAEPFVDEALDAIDLESIGDRDPAAEERPRRRRRRRGRGRGRRPEGEAAPPIQPTASAFEEPPPFGADAATDVTADDDIVAEPDLAESDHGESDSGESDSGESDRAEPDHAAGLEPRRPDDTEEGRETRRRRRRRGRGRRGRREEGAVVDAERPPRQREEPVASAPAPARAELDDSDEDDSLEAIEQEDELGGEDEDQGDDSQLSHKKIPSWQEAIEAVIATNMTSRVNNPSSGGQRGGRGRGRRDR